MYRQGDVLIVPADVPIPDTAPVAAALILAHGEVTGHAHRVSVPVRSWEADGALYFEIPLTGGEVRHEEHGAIFLPPGVYRKAIPQREYSPEAIRNVRD